MFPYPVPPWTDPTSRRDEDEQLHLDTQSINGNKGTVLRDAEGRVAYPSYVPPDVQSPTLSRISERSPSPPREQRQPPPSGQAGKSEPEPPPRQSLDENRSPEYSHRPPLDKRAATDAPREFTRRPGDGRPAQRQRADTRPSYLNRAIWQATEQGRDAAESSADSSSGGESEGGGEEDSAGHAKESAARRRRQGMTEDQYRRFRVINENYKTTGRVKKDGRLRITLEETANAGYLAKALGAAVEKAVPKCEQKDERRNDTFGRSFGSSPQTPEDAPPRPRLNIVIMVIGSRGDAQPFLKIGKVLKEQYGHRVRIATHPAFREFVEKDSGLEFFSVGGDPSELMAFMVKNPGMIPTLETVKAGDIGRRRAAMAEMFQGFWRACVNATDDEKDVRNLGMMGVKGPFVADAIIANPPSFAHVHCAEALGIPLHLMFTFPYTPTQDFPHPLASIKRSNVDPGYTNFISYPLVEMMVWQGLGDLVNEFRVRTLALDTVSTLWAPGATYRLHVPYSYLWSPGLVPKPADWGDEIDVSGFVFLDLASSFDPPAELEKFLAAGPPPVYIGFGSIVVDDPENFTQMIFEAVKLAGVRALVSRGWGGLGQDDLPVGIYMLENTPHDWLFPRVEACVIHGGAGTTAIALKCGKPSLIVPFFGDQHFWGSMIGSAGAGPNPVPYKHLTAEKLAEGIKFCLTDQAKEAAQRIARDIDAEGDGAVNAVRSFHRHLNLDGPRSMRCSILRDHVAVWQPKNSHIKLSPLAADILVSKGLLQWKRLRLLRHTDWNDFEGPGEPVTGLAGSIATSVGNFFGGIGSVPYRIAKTSQEHKAKRKRRQARLERRAKVKSAAKQQQQQTGNAPATTAATPGPARPAVTPGDMASAGTLATTPAGGATGAQDYFGQVKTGVGRSASALARAPVDLALAIAQGFHNAPKIYGDETVRRGPRVTGIHSGLRAAQFEFVYGIYDGWTGVVRLPYRGAKKDGVAGFAKGVGMGVTGFVLKDLAAIIGPFAYTLKGLVKQAERSRRPTQFVRRARIAQGQRERGVLSGPGRTSTEAEVLEGWRAFSELIEAVDAEVKRKGIKGQLSSAFTVSAGTPDAFRGVDMARRALEALGSGESVEEALFWERGQRRKAKEEGEEERKRKLSAEREERRGLAGGRSSESRSRTLASLGGMLGKKFSGGGEQKGRASERNSPDPGHAPGQAVGEEHVEGVGTFRRE